MSQRTREETEHVGADAAAVVSACSIDTQTAPHVVTVQWAFPEPMGLAPIEAQARQSVSVNELLVYLNRVRPENRDLPLVFQLRSDVSVPRSILIYLVTRPRRLDDTTDVVDGDKAVFMPTDRGFTAMQFILPPPEAEFAIATATVSLSEASGSIRSEAP